MSRVVSYILNNPVKAGLVKRAEEYPFSGVSSDSVNWMRGPDKARANIRGPAPHPQHPTPNKSQGI